MKSFKQFIKEYSEYSPLQIGLKIKFNLKDGILGLLLKYIQMELKLN
jgi:hypothetical protein